MATSKRRPVVKVRGRLDWNDQIAANRLSRKTAISWLWTVSLVAFMTVTALYAFFGRNLTLAVYFILLLSLILYSFGSPRRIKKKFATDPDLSAPFEIVFSDKTVSYKSKHEKSKFGRSLVKHWRSNDKVTLIYFAGNRFLFVPHRLISGSKQLDIMQGYFKQNVGPAYKGPMGPSVIMTLFFAFITWMLIWPIIQAVLN